METNIYTTLMFHKYYSIITHLATPPISHYICNMEKRIKVIYIITAIVLILILFMQGEWLHSQYQYNLTLHQTEIEEIFEETMLEQTSIREQISKEKKDSSKHMVTSSLEHIYDNINGVRNTKIEYVILSYNNNVTSNSISDVVNTAIVNAVTAMSDSIAKNAIIVDSIINSDQAYVDGYRVKDLKEEYRFNITDTLPDNLHYGSVDKFLLDLKVPLEARLVDSILKSKNVTAQVELIKADSMVWYNNIKVNKSIWRPHITALLPYDNLEGELISIEYKVPYSPITVRMARSLTISFLLFALTFYSFMYQIITIRKQYKIDEMRKNFLHTMIHELKRPISTLKMCVSAMRNPKIMDDAKLKEQILQDSYNELDNLTAYFSKLREVALANDNYIPLNITQFELSTAIKECIDKISKPNDKEVEIEVINHNNMLINADKMHLQNIIFNLIENAIKYSGKKVTITINHYYTNNYTIIEINDNGFGIADSDKPYIFDKFYRGKGTIEQGTPGIGLGLSYVKLLVNAHKGSISLQSKLGIGTNFTIKISDSL